MIQCGVNKFPDRPSQSGIGDGKAKVFIVYLGDGRVTWDKGTRLFLLGPGP